MYRLDAANTKLTWKKDDRGYTAWLSLGKAGNPLEYFNFDGKQLQRRIETIQEDELFRDDSVATTMALPIVLGHPKAGKFNTNAEGLQVGSLLQEVKREDGSLLVLAQVHDHRGIKLIDEACSRGETAEVSPGYSLSGLRQDGSTFLQQGRSYDHVALLSPGFSRGGSHTAFRTDSIDFEPDTAVSPKLFFIPQKPMIILRLDNREFRTEDKELADAVNAVLERKDAAEASVASLTGELEGTKARLSEAENARLDASALNQEIQLRLDTWAVVEPSLRKDNKDFNRDNSLTVDEIRISYLQKAAPDALKRLDSNDPNYSIFVSGLWEALKPQQRTDAADAAEVANAELDEIDSFQRTDSINPGSEAKKQAIAKLENAYKN